MGNWYTNVMLKDVRPADLILQLEELGRRAIVDQTNSEWLVVYDAECIRRAQGMFGILRLL